MHTSSRAYRRILALVLASMLGCAAAVGLTGTPAAAAIPAPAISSFEYPAGLSAGAIGVPGVFTVTAAADDTVSYHYRFYSSELGQTDVEATIDANGLGGPANIGWTPRAAGSHSLGVYAIDRAGNRSEGGYYAFKVRETRPSVSSSAYPDWGSNLDYNVGVPGAFQFTATVADTASFEWRIDDDGPSGTVAADASGRATAMIAPSRGGRQTLYVHSVTRTGTAHAPRAYEFFVDNAPTITRDTGKVLIGSSLTFRLAPRMPHVEAYVYWLNYSRLEQPPVEKITVPARADGTADLVWTAMETDINGLRVQSRSADGTLSEPRWAPVSVDGARPTVTRTGGDGLGELATITAHTPMVNVVEYVVTLSGEEGTQVLQPAADGSLIFSFAPTKRDYNWVSVVARNAAGVQTTEGVTSWTVTDAPRVTSTEFPENGVGWLATGTFTFTPRLPGTITYSYSITARPFVDGQRSTTIAAEPDGSATVTWTPPAPGRYFLAVRSSTTSTTDFGSMRAAYEFTVEPIPATVASVGPATVPAGGVRTIVIRGTNLHPRDAVQVTPLAGEPLTATVKTVSTDGTMMSAEVDLATASTGPAGFALHPHNGSPPTLLANAFTISPPPPLRVIKPPTIRGTVAAGNTVTADPGKWLPTATNYQYQWSADGTPIPGETDATLKIPPVLAGQKLTVTVTASRNGYASAKATSFPVTVASSAATRTTKQPKTASTTKVSPTGQAARTIETNNDAAPPITNTYRFEWRINGKLIRGTMRAQL